MYILLTYNNLFAQSLQSLGVVVDSCYDSLKGCKLAVQPEEKEHNEEQDCPEWRYWHESDGLREH